MQKQDALQTQAQELTSINGRTREEKGSAQGNVTAVNGVQSIDRTSIAAKALLLQHILAQLRQKDYTAAQVPPSPSWAMCNNCSDNSGVALLRQHAFSRFVQQWLDVMAQVFYWST